MVRNLLKAGYDVTVWNRTRSKAEALEADGAQAVGSPAEAVRDAAHTLKASSANIGAHALADLCKRVEDLARATNLDEIPALTDPLYAEYDRVLQALHAESAKAEDSAALV